jgi:hypothetical protein
MTRQTAINQMSVAQEAVDQMIFDYIVAKSPGLAFNQEYSPVKTSS